MGPWLPRFFLETIWSISKIPPLTHHLHTSVHPNVSTTTDTLNFFSEDFFSLVKPSPSKSRQSQTYLVNKEVLSAPRLIDSVHPRVVHFRSLFLYFWLSGWEFIDHQVVLRPLRLFRLSIYCDIIVFAGGGLIVAPHLFSAFFGAVRYLIGRWGGFGETFGYVSIRTTNDKGEHKDYRTKQSKPISTCTYHIFTQPHLRIIRYATTILKEFLFIDNYL